MLSVSERPASAARRLPRVAVPRVSVTRVAVTLGIVTMTFGTSGVLSAHASVPAGKRVLVKAARPDVGDARLLADINRARTRAGLRPLRFNGRLAAVAVTWSKRLAATNQLTHNPLLAADVDRAVPDWVVLAENVATASKRPVVTAADKIFSGYMASPLHRANLMNPSVNLIGLGTTRTHSGASFNVVDLAG